MSEPRIDDLRAYAGAWCAEQEYLADAERSGRAVTHTVNVTSPVRDREWSRLLAAKEEAFEKLGFRDYHHAQHAIFALFATEQCSSRISVPSEGGDRP